MDSLINDQAEAQLRADLQNSLQRAHRAKKPILTHLNADTTWLLSLAYPEPTRASPGRSRYNLLIDPWLDGPQEDVAGWFSKQWHPVKSCVQTIVELEDLLHAAEALEDDHDGRPHSTMTSSWEDSRSYIDAVVISHEFTDHCHRTTLLQLNTSTPVFATNKAARLIRSWKYFDNVVEMATFSPKTDWRTTSLSPLPDWIGISRLVTSFDVLLYHSAVLICVQQAQSTTAVADTIIYTPHGVDASTVSILPTASPRLDVLAFLHGLHDVSIRWSKQLNLGALNAVKAQKVLRAKYWVGTHDEEKPGSGLIAPFLYRKVMAVSEVVAQIKAEDIETTEGARGWMEGLTCLELGNGESLLLE